MHDIGHEGIPALVRSQLLRSTPGVRQRRTHVGDERAQMFDRTVHRADVEQALSTVLNASAHCREQQRPRRDRRHMFSFGIAAPPAPPPAAARIPDPHHKLVDGADIYPGVIAADVMAAGQRQVSVPSGKGYYHVNISLFDAETKRAITDARVQVKVADPFGTETKTLEVISANNTSV